MKSEIIVVLVLIAFAVGFIIWVRMQSQAGGAPPSAQAPEENRKTKNS
jgi:flagellar basal body-associated protein FliL